MGVSFCCGLFVGSDKALQFYSFQVPESIGVVRGIS